MWDNLTVKGFHFNSAAEYADAKREAETIDHICTRMDVKNPDIALKVYYKLLDKQSFHTIVGIYFLKQLRDIISEEGIVDEEELKSIHAPILLNPDETTEMGDETALENSSSMSDISEEVKDNLPEETDTSMLSNDTLKVLNRKLADSKQNEKKQTDLANYFKGKIKQLYIIIAALAIVIAVLIGVAYYNNNLVFTNEEIAVQDKYAAWEEDLKQREADLKLREEELNTNN